MRTLLLALAAGVIAFTTLAAQAPLNTSAFAPPSDLAMPPADAIKGASGLVSRVIKAGDSDEKPGPNDVVTVQYTGWASDGHMFDSSLSRSKPSMFPLNRAMLGWRECVQLMRLHETRRCWVPENLAYKGAAGRPKGTVVFDIELLDRRLSPTVPPPDVKEPPADAKKQADGLAYKVLRAGTGLRHPTQFSRVTVHYSGWTTDGKLFDSSVARATPSTFDLGGGVIKGWTEALPLMVEGERARFWIPQDLAYKGEPGNPRGMLVFEIDLIKIE
jgi:FKBP-type peptidyl-prolyl cis-trans isomerase